jgi:hypothetical protein
VSENTTKPTKSPQTTQPDRSNPAGLTSVAVSTSCPQGKPKKLLEQVSDALRTKHYAYRTEQTYVDWIKRYIIFHKKRHPKDMGAEEIRQFIASSPPNVKSPHPPKIKPSAPSFFYIAPSSKKKSSCRPN